MAQFYKFEIANWNEGTATMSLELEAAYLRVVNAIRLNDQPITISLFVLGGLWRCNDRKAKRLLQELVDTGKVRIEGGKLINDKAVEDASTLSRLSAERASAGRRGGFESANTRRKSLKTNNTTQASASTRKEENRKERKKENFLDFQTGKNANGGTPKPADTERQRCSPQAAAEIIARAGIQLKKV